MPEADPMLCRDAAALLRERVLESIEVKRRTLEASEGQILAAAAALAACFHGGGKALLCGNGGSAADCQHVAAELVSSLQHERTRAPLAAVALTTDTSVLTANANDYGFEGVFERQVEALARPGDVLLAFSTSGDSVNVIRAVRSARELGAVTVALTGNRGALAPLADIAIRVESANSQHIQETHITIAHILCEIVERTLFGHT
jgi:D-sedoheptulose 7-phosphate isomerase